MQINNYFFSLQENQRVFYILNKFREVFPLVKISKRKTIIGIGEPNKHLMCYFILIDNKLKIKFKNRNHLPI